MNLNDKFRSFLSNASHLRYALLLAFGLRIFLFLIGHLWEADNLINENFVGSDSRGYHVLAVNLLETKSFDTFGAFRTPGYPLFIAGVYALFGKHPFIVVIFQIFFELFSVVFVYLIGKKLLNTSIGLLASFLYAIDPHTILFTGTLQSDTLFVTVFLCSLYFFISAIKEKKIFYFFLSGLILGVTTLVRPISQFFPVVLILLVVIYTSIPISFKIKGALVLVLSFLLGICPWIFRNYRQYHTPALSSIQGANLLFYSAAYTEVIKTGKSIDQVREDFSQQAASAGAEEKYNPVKEISHEQLWRQGLAMYADRHNPFINSQIYSRIAGNYIKANLKYYIPRHVKGIFNMFFGLESRGISYRLGLATNTFKFDYFAAPGIFEMVKGFILSKPIGGIVTGFFVAVFLFICYASSLIGLYELFIEKKYFIIFFILVTIAYFSMLVGVVGLCRYKLPIIPIYLLSSAYGIYYLSDLIHRRCNVPIPTSFL